MAPTVSDLGKVSRGDIAHRNFRDAIERTRRAEEETERALDQLADAAAEMLAECGVRVDPEFRTAAFETAWQDRRVRLLALQESR